MAVGEGESATVVVPRGREADPKPLGGAEELETGGVGGEAGLLDAILVSVNNTKARVGDG